MKTSVKVKVINDLSLEVIELEKIIVFCINGNSEIKKHSSSSLIDNSDTHFVRVENTPTYDMQVFALVNDGSIYIAQWYPVTVTRSV